MNANTFRFTDEATDSFIEMERSCEFAWINNYYVDPDNCKLFMLLLKTAFSNMKQKECKKYQQLAMKQDWNNFMKENPEWTIVRSDYETILVECDIDLAPELIVDGFLRNNKN